MRRNVTQNFVFSIICKLPYYINWTLYPYIKSYDLILSNNFFLFFYFYRQKRKKDEFDNDYREDWQRNHKHSPDERQRISHSEKCFTVHPRNKYNTSAPAFRKPMFVGDFCLDENRMFCHDKRNLHYININWQESKKVSFYVPYPNITIWIDSDNALRLYSVLCNFL